MASEDRKPDALVVRWSIPKHMSVAVILGYPAAFGLYRAIFVNPFGRGSILFLLILLTFWIIVLASISRIIDRRTQVAVDHAGVFCRWFTPQFIPAANIQEVFIFPGMYGLTARVVTTEAVIGHTSRSRWLWTIEGGKRLFISDLAMLMLDHKSADITGALGSFVPQRKEANTSRQ